MLSSHRFDPSNARSYTCFTEYFELPNFTGIDSPYEAPLNPELTLNAGEDSVEVCVQRILDYLS